MITRATHTQWPSDHAIQDLRPTGLPAAPVVRFQVFTFDNRILQRRSESSVLDYAGGCATTLRKLFKD